MKDILATPSKSRQACRIPQAQITQIRVGRFRLCYSGQRPVDRLLDGFFGAIRDLRELIPLEVLLRRYVRRHGLKARERRLLWKVYLREADVTGEFT